MPFATTVQAGSDTIATGSSSGASSSGAPGNERTSATKQQTATVRFVLAHPRVGELVLRGPGPSCRVAGRVRVRGHTGVNRIHFSRRVGGRLLKPGLYAVAFVPTHGATQALPVVYLRVDASGKIAPAPAKAVGPLRHCVALELGAPTANKPGAGVVPLPPAASAAGAASLASAPIKASQPSGSPGARGPRKVVARRAARKPRQVVTPPAVPQPSQVFTPPVTRTSRPPPAGGSRAAVSGGLRPSAGGGGGFWPLAALPIGAGVIALLGVLALVGVRHRQSGSQAAATSAEAEPRLYEIRTVTTETGEEPVERWVRDLDAPNQAEVILAVGLLERHGRDLGPPHARPVGDDLWELRVRLGEALHHIVYMPLKTGTLVLLHGFTKKSHRLDRSDLETAKEHWAVWFARDRGKQ